jgi:hypothetical protein
VATGHNAWKRIGFTAVIGMRRPKEFCRPRATQRGGRAFAGPRRPGFRARRGLFDPDCLLAARHRLRVVARRFLAELGGATFRPQRVIASSREDEKRRPGGTRIPSRGSERDLASLPSSRPARQHLIPILRQRHYDSHGCARSFFSFLCRAIGARFRRIIARI